MTTHDTVRALGYPSHTRTEWAAEISGSWGKVKVAVAEAVETIFRTGDLLERAKRDQGHGNWLEMAQSDLPFSVRQAQMLMKIARDQRLGKKCTRAYLPGSVPILHALTGLDDETFKQMLAGNRIGQQMSIAEVKSAKFLERTGKTYLFKYKPPKKAKAAPAPAKAKAAAPPRPQPISPATAESLLDFLTRLVAFMRAAPPNIARSARYLPSEQRHEVAVLTNDAIAWLNRIYEAVS